MIQLRKGEERGHTGHDWLNAYQTFSFGAYQDPAHMGFRVLRVLNDDRIAPGRGFGPHAHRDMEIISYVLEGRLLHRDSTGEQHIVGPNEIQLMSAGTGIVHSEFNASEDEPAHLLQIWIEPASEDLEPSYQQIAFEPQEKSGRFRLLAGPEPVPGEEAAIINQNVCLYVAEVRPKETLRWVSTPRRHVWMQIAKGGVTLNGQLMKEGDGAAVSGEQELSLVGNEREGGELLLFDLP